MKIGFVHVAQRPDSWGFYYRWLIRTQTEHQLVDCWEDVGHNTWEFSGKDCDVYLRVGDSMMYHTPEWMHPLIYYVSDTHVSDGVDCAAIALKADYVYVCQKSALDIGNEWLPHAAYYFPQPISEPQFLVSSCVTLNAENDIFKARTATASAIMAEFGNRAKIGRGPVHMDMANLYADSLTVWNESVEDDVNMRLFEGGAAGSVVLANPLNEIDELFDGLVTQYQSLGHLLGLIEFYSKDVAAYRKRGLKMQECVKNKHTYMHRLKVILERAEKLIPRKKSGRPQSAHDLGTSDTVQEHAAPST
jgi:hypothetical protein